MSTVVSSVYVHAPFCARRCVYCDFAVTVRRTGGVEEWLEALAAEVAWVEAEGLFTLADRLRTLYVGGGTPSLLGPDAMRGLGEVLGRSRLGPAAATDSSNTLEWTAEANPESFTPDVAGGWAAAGVNRISLGLQTFHEPALRWMGRLHGPDGPPRALDVARESGIENVSVDLIFGLPASVGRSWDDDLKRVLALDVPHVSLYGLTVEDGTALGRAVREGRERPVDEDQYRSEFERAAEVLVEAGYEHYEVSSFARPGARSQHNAVYWEGGAYLGLGNGAHAYAPPIRRWNDRSWEDYRRRLLDGSSPEAERETVGEPAHRLERIWLGLRTSEGIPLPAAGSPAADLVSEWVDSELATLSVDRVRLTTQGWLLLDRLSVELDACHGVFDLR
jgi:oxygen-independent coproporphyrinogen-3 oxidase